MARYLVTGGFGFLGQYIVKELLDREQDCTVVVASRSKKKTLLAVEKDPRVEFVRCDLTTEKDFFFLKGIDYVIHNAALVSILGKEEDLLRINVEGTRNIVLACNKYPIKRFVHVSSIAAVGGEDGGISDESQFLDPHKDDASSYAKSKALAEQVVREEYDGEYVVGCPSLITGAGSVQLAEALGRIKRLPVLPVWGKVQNIVDVRDVASGIYLILKKGKDKERYLLTNQDVPFDSFLKKVVKMLGWRRVMVRVPTRIIRMAKGPVMLYSRISSNPIVTPRTLRTLLEGHGYSNKKIRDLGLKFSYSLDDTVTHLCDWLKNLPELE